MSRIVDVAYADVVLVNEANWTAAAAAVKQQALDNAEVFFNANFRCNDWTSLRYAIPDPVDIDPSIPGLVATNADFIDAGFDAGDPVRIRGLVTNSANLTRVLATVEVTQLTFVSDLDLVSEIGATGIILDSPQTVKDSICYLALDDVENGLYPAQVTTTNVQEKELDAQGVKTRTRYSGSSSTVSGNRLQAANLVAGLCTTTFTESTVLLDRI